LTNNGYEFLFRRLIAPYTTRVSFSKATDRRVTGSINELIFEAKLYLAERQLSPFETSRQINETLMSYLGYNSPKEAFRALKVEPEEASSNSPECGEE